MTASPQDNALRGVVIALLVEVAVAFPIFVVVMTVSILGGGR